MTVKSISGWAVALPLLFTFGASSPARASALDIDRMPVTNAIAELDHAFGVTIVVKGTLNPNTLVDLSVDDTDAPGAVVDAVNQLSNDIGASFQKSYLISDLPKTEAVPRVHVDSTSEIYFDDNRVDARDAIERVANLDMSDVRYIDPVSGSIFLSDVDFTLPDAANEIARATHTRWLAVYTLTLGNSEPQGKIVDRTNEGQPIVQLPYTEYDAPLPKPTPAATSSKPAATTSQAADNQPALAAPNQFDFNSLLPPNSGLGYLPDNSRYITPSYTYSNGIVATTPTYYYSP